MPQEVVVRFLPSVSGVQGKSIHNRSLTNEGKMQDASLLDNVRLAYSLALVCLSNPMTLD
jgi:hypothetical protein